MRFTKTWSPISSVFSMELDGISNACTTNVMMNSPVTNTAASDERNSTVDSLGFSSATLSSNAISFFADFFSVIIDVCSGTNFAPARFMRRWKYSVYQSQRAVPAREVIEPALNRRRRIFVPVPYRPVNDQRFADNIFPRHESPIAAVLAVIAVIAQHEIMPLGKNQLAVFHQFPHLQPPFAFQAKGGDVGSGEIIAEHIIGRFQKSHVGLIQRLALDTDLLVLHPQVVARYSDHAFDKVLLRIHGIVKHDDVPALDLLIGHK